MHHTIYLVDYNNHHLFDQALPKAACALGNVLGGNASSGEEGGEKGSSSSGKEAAVRERLGYEQLEKVIEELVAWLDEGSL
jgi:hypothetical protein